MTTLKRLWNWLGSNPETLAQLAHVGWGGFLTLLLHAHYSMTVSAIAVGVFALGKELAEYWTESAVTRGSTIIDILFFWMGILAAYRLG